MGKRGPKPGTVTKPAGSGRKPGQQNRATLEIKELARAYGPKAIAELARLAGLTKDAGSENEATRVTAIKELIDRGYGRPTQPISGDDDAPPVQVEHAFAGQRVKSLLDQITAK
jgi:hypothetical protein